ncbi:hypothetical protein QF041_005364 [Paenibacillus sp. W2I17]|nr:hypothetical protein [Paenibacillus sp. W2I17]
MKKNYNSGFTNKKESENQKKCYLCGNWDRYIYSVLLKSSKIKVLVCFQCYHEGLNKNFEDI